MRSSFDIEFENAFVGNRQMSILHKYHVGNDVYHICTINSNDYYFEGWFKFDPTDYTFVLTERP